MTADELEYENCKLRELVRKMRMWESRNFRCKDLCPLFERCISSSMKCAFWKLVDVELLELGIEVEDE